MNTRFFKAIFILCLCFGINIPSIAAVAVSEGSAFVTKAEIYTTLNTLSNDIFELEKKEDKQIDLIVNEFVNRNSVWHPKEQILDDTKSNMVVEPYAIASAGSYTVGSERTFIPKINKSGLLVFLLSQSSYSKEKKVEDGYYLWGISGKMTAAGNWTCDNGLQLTVDFYEKPIGGSRTMKYSYYYGSVAAGKGNYSNSNYDYVMCFPTPIVPVASSICFFVSKGSSVSWSAIEAIKIATGQTSTVKKVCDITDEKIIYKPYYGRNLSFTILNPVVY